LEVIFNLNHLENTYFPSKKTSGVPLGELIMSSEVAIAKCAMYGFLETSNGFNPLTLKLASSLKLIKFVDIASSSFTPVFQFYLGELARRFTVQGRVKAILHLARFVHKLIVPLFEEGVHNPHPENRAYHFSNMSLIIAVAGVPITDVDPKKGAVTVDSLLFSAFQPYLSSLFTLKNHWTGKSLFKCFYFLHRDLVVFILAELSELFQNSRHNSNVFTSTEFIDNAFFILRYLILQPHMGGIIQESPEFAKELFGIYIDFISFCSHSTFEDHKFIDSGTELQLKTAINYCIVAQKICECICNIRGHLVQKLGPENYAEQYAALGLEEWTCSQRRSIINQFKEWYQTLELQKRNVSDVRSINASKPTDFIAILKHKVCLATQQMMIVGGIYVEPPLPSGLLNWFSQMEGDGFRVFVPEFLYVFEDALGTTLTSSYANTGLQPYSFTAAAFEQVLPRLENGIDYFLNNDGDRLSFAKAFIAGKQSLPLQDFEINSPSILMPDLSPEHLQRLRRHLGSLLFYGNFNCNIRPI
jgi:hypothetical protein